VRSFPLAADPLLSGVTWRWSPEGVSGGSEKRAAFGIGFTHDTSPRKGCCTVTFCYRARVAAAILALPAADIRRVGRAVVSASDLCTDTPWSVSPNNARTCCSLEISGRTSVIMLSLLNLFPRVADAIKKDSTGGPFNSSTYSSSFFVFWLLLGVVCPTQFHFWLTIFQ
jgi:hypothetical protein